MAKPRGTDVSHYQGDIDWDAYARRNGFAFCSIGDGDVADELWTPARVRALREAKLRDGFGVYYYGRVASRANGWRGPERECEMALARSRAAGWGRKGVDLRFAYDFEEANGQSLPAAGKHLVGFILAHREREGYKPILYGPYAFLASLNRYLSLDERKLVRGCPLWIADLEGPVNVPAPWTSDKDFAIRQHTFTDKEKGIRGPVDGDKGGPEFDRCVIPG